jgi:hypothetical protein
MTYISDADLRRMTFKQLSHAFLTDPPNSHRYRPEINRRIAAGDREAVAAFGNSEPFRPTLHTSGSVGKPPPDIRDLWVEVKRDQAPMTGLATIILDSGWDFKDPIGKMGMPPESVEDFLKSLQFHPDQYFSELPLEMQRVLNMIFDVYGRWYRSQVPA